MPEEAVAIVLAAGRGTRMKSDLPKVLHPVCGRPMIHYVLDRLAEAGIGRVLVVVGFRADLVRRELAGRSRIEFVEQTQQLGTGHAVQECRPLLFDFEGPVVVVTGDSPMLQVSSLRALLEEYRRSRPACILGTRTVDRPQGLGRIVRDEQGEFVGIVEERDATPQQREIREVNLSTYVFDCQALFRALGYVQNNNAKREFYLTDCPGILRSLGCGVLALPVLKACEALSVNTPEELARVEAEMQRMLQQRAD